MAHAQRVVLQKTDFRRDAHLPASNNFGALKPFNKNDVNNSGAKRRPDPLLSRYNSRDSPTKRLQTESSGPIEIQVHSRMPPTQRELIYENLYTPSTTTPPNVDQNQQSTYSTPTKLQPTNTTPKYDQTMKRPREEQQPVAEQPPSKIQRTTYNHVTHSTIGPITSSPPKNNPMSTNNSAPQPQRSPASVQPNPPTVSPANVNYNRSSSQPVLSTTNRVVDSSSPPQPDTQPGPDPEPHSFSQPSPVNRSGSASGTSFMTSSQPSTQAYTPNTTPYSSQSSQATVAINNGSSSQPNMDEVQTLKIEISKLKAMLRKANNDYKKIVDEAATSTTTNQQQQQDNSAALVQEIDQLRNEIELLKQQKDEAIQQAIDAQNTALVPINTNTHVVPASDVGHFNSNSGYHNGPNNGAIEKLQEMNMYLMSMLETVRNEREKDATKLKKVEQEIDTLNSKNGELAQCLNRTEKQRKTERQARKQKEAEAQTLKQQIEELAKKLEEEEALRKQQQEELARVAAAAVNNVPEPVPQPTTPVPAVELDMTIMNDKQLEKCFLRMYLELKRRREEAGAIGGVPPDQASEPYFMNRPLQ
jgi:hypothetical protein